jgi:glycosyltransferase 2 family protein
MIRKVLLSRPAKLIVSLALVVAVISEVGPRAVIPGKLAWEWLVGAALLFLASNIIGAFQWNLLLRAADISLPRHFVNRAYFVALFFNNFLIGNVGGDVLRAIDVGRESSGDSGGTEAGVATIVMDRFLGFFTLMCFAFVAALVASEQVRVGATIFTLLGVFVVLGVLITSRRMGTAADTFILRLVPDRLAQRLVNLRMGFVSLRQSPTTLVRAWALSVAMQGMRILVHFMCSRALGLEIPLIYFMTFIPIVSVAAAIPISLGGLGTREWAAVALFGSVGVAGAGVVTMELLAHGVTLVSSLPGAIAFVTRSRNVNEPIENLEDSR